MNQEGMGFSEALEHIKAGKRVRRESWFEKGLSIALIPGTGNINFQDRIDLRTTIPKADMPWTTISVADLLADDWQDVDEKPKQEE